MTPSTTSKMITASYSSPFAEWIVDGVIPHSNVEEGTPEDNEERRCFYVAVTRAKRYLYFMMPDVINVYGETVRTEGSRYLRGIM